MSSDTKSSARAGGLGRSGDQRIGQDPAPHVGTPPNVEMLLTRLDRVRRCGKGWLACCPAHADRQASLSVAVGQDGRILVHCFAGCAITDVLRAVGLTMPDLFPLSLADTSPEGRRVLREAARQLHWRAALGVLAREATVVCIAAHAVLKGELTDEDAQRVVVAVERIDAAREVLQ